VALNLISNAISNTFEGGVTLYLYYDSDRQHLKVKVEDTGIGIEDKEQQHIFEMLKKQQKLIDYKNTIGIGLLISKYMV
jgi:signal transduction histidine kinase